MAKCNEDDIVVVTTTVGTMQAATALARAVVQARLAACVQLEAIAASHYRWEGAHCEEPEVRLVIKTVGSRVAPLEALFAERHPYELPQFVVAVVQASDAYAAWVRGEVAAG
jgi:periplasmic divalent cation tolerance protein